MPEIAHATVDQATDIRKSLVSKVLADLLERKMAGEQLDLQAELAKYDPQDAKRIRLAFALSVMVIRAAREGQDDEALQPRAAKAAEVV